ncbi:MAG: UPF0262 family protein [Alphaproteobacteria bacterium]
MSETPPEDAPSTERIVNVSLDERTIVRRSADVEHERAVAIYDLLEKNHFAPAGLTGPYHLVIGVEDERLVFDIRDEKDQPLDKLTLPLQIFRRIVRDYFMVCESYYAAIKTASPSRIEALDMGRRGLHNEGSELLRDKVAGKIDMDVDTARRLFTLICVLHIRG